MAHAYARIGFAGRLADGARDFVDRPVLVDVARRRRVPFGGGPTELSEHEIATSDGAWLIGVIDGYGEVGAHGRASDRVGDVLAEATGGPDSLVAALSLADRTVVTEQRRHPPRDRQLARACVGVLERDSLALATIGDPRAYVLRRGAFVQVNANDWEEHPIANYLGGPAYQVDDFHRVPIRRGDRWLFTTDKLVWDFSDEDRKRWLEAEASPRAAADRLVEEVAQAEIRELLCVVVDFTGDDLLDPEDDDPPLERRGPTTLPLVGDG